jgi:hypothetical protein
LSDVLDKSTRARSKHGGPDAVPSPAPARSRGDGHDLRKTPSRAAPTWESAGRQRVRDVVRQYAGPLSDLITRDATEEDTRLLVTDFLCEALGYNTSEDLTTGCQVRGTFADYGLRIDQQLIACVEVKRCTTTLTVRHLRQVELYAVAEGIEWMILTNGRVWQIWHLTPEPPAPAGLILEVDLLSEESASVKADGLFFLAKESLRRRQIDELLRAQAATSPAVLADVVLSEPVLGEIRTQLRRRTGHNVGPKDLRELLRRSVIRDEALAT